MTMVNMLILVTLLMFQGVSSMPNAPTREAVQTEEDTEVKPKRQAAGSGKCDVPKLEHANITDSTGTVMSGTVLVGDVEVNCHDGYYIDGTNGTEKTMNTKCDGTGWLHEPQECEPDPGCDADSLEIRNVDSIEGLKHGNIVNVTCKPGHYEHPMEHDVTCHWGNFVFTKKTPQFECKRSDIAAGIEIKPEDCDPESVKPENGTVAPSPDNGIKAGQSVKLACNQGYSLAPNTPDTINCTTGGYLLLPSPGRLPKCIVNPSSDTTPQVTGTTQPEVATSTSMVSPTSGTTVTHDTEPSTTGNTVTDTTEPLTSDSSTDTSLSTEETPIGTSPPPPPPGPPEEAGTDAGKDDGGKGVAIAGLIFALIACVLAIVAIVLAYMACKNNSSTKAGAITPKTSKMYTPSASDKLTGTPKSSQEDVGAQVPEPKSSGMKSAIKNSITTTAKEAPPAK